MPTRVMCAQHVNLPLTTPTDPHTEIQTTKCTYTSQFNSIEVMLSKAQRVMRLVSLSIILNFLRAKYLEE